MSNIQKATVWSCTFVLFMLGVFVLKDVLLPFVAGIAIAYFLDPLTARIEKRVHSRTIALIIVFSALILFFLLSVFIVAPIIRKQLSMFLSNLPIYANLFWVKVEPYVMELRKLFPKEELNLRQTITEHLSQAVNIVLRASQRLLSRSMALINLASLLLITPVVAFYLLRDWAKFGDSFKSLIPRQEANTIHELLSEINDTIAGFVRGQATVCLILGGFYAVGLTLSGLDLGLLIGLAIGVLSFIPYVGSTLGLVISVSLALVQFNDWKKIAVVVVIFFVGQLVEGNILTPKFVGEKVGLHPVWVMFALLAGATLFGFLGVLIAVPVAAVIGVFVRFFVIKYKESPLYLGTLSSIQND